MEKKDEVRYNKLDRLADDADLPAFLAEKIAEGEAEGNLATVLVILHQNYDELGAGLDKTGLVGVKLTGFGSDENDPQKIQEMTCLALGHSLVTRMDLGKVEHRHNVIQMARAWCVYYAEAALEAFKKSKTERN